MRRLVAVAAALLAAVAATGCGGDEKPAATIDDPAFVRAANAVCKPAIAKLRAPDRKAPTTTALRAATIDTTADGVAAVADKLRALPVRAEDEARVKAWLADWDAFVAVGHRYADAVASGEPERYTKVDDEAVQVSERIGRFAKGNGIDECIL